MGASASTTGARIVGGECKSRKLAFGLKRHRHVAVGLLRERRAPARLLLTLAGRSRTGARRSRSSASKRRGSVHHQVSCADVGACMPSHLTQTMVHRTTFSLDDETVEALRRLAGLWNTSQAGDSRRAVRIAAERCEIRMTP